MVRIARGARRPAAEDRTPLLKEGAENIVSSADFVRRFGRWQELANRGPVRITHHGRPRQVLLSIADYDALRRAQADGSAPDPASALKLGTLLHQLDMALIGIDADLRVTTINPAACAYLGIAAAGAIGRPAAAVLREMALVEVREGIATALETGRSVRFEIAAQERPGEWLRCVIFAAHDRAAIMFRVVTGERSAAIVTRDRRALDEALAAAGGVGEGELSLQGTFGAVSQTLAAMAGFAPGALRGVRLTDILPMGRRTAAATEIETVLTHGGDCAFETALLVKQGGEYPVRIALAARQGDFGIDGATIVARARAA